MKESSEEVAIKVGWVNGPKVDKIGKRFHKLVVIGIATERVRSWVCICDCGNRTVVAGNNLKYSRGAVKSCGCARDGHPKHRRANTPIYKRWSSMVERCHNPNCDAFKNYGARGIKVCDRWRKFDLFFKDMGQPPKGFSIDRIDNNGNYEPGNCRWATNSQQSNNTRKNIIITIDGSTNTLAQWSRIYSFNYKIAHQRFHNGWPRDERLFEDSPRASMSR